MNEHEPSEKTSVRIRNGGAPEGPASLSKRSWWGIMRRTVREFREDNLTDWAAALTYYGVLAMFPALLVMVSVFASGILFGPLAIILAIPAVSVVTTLVDVIVRDRDPAEEDVPTVLFPAKEAER